MIFFYYHALIPEPHNHSDQSSIVNRLTIMSWYITRKFTNP